MSDVCAAPRAVPISNARADASRRNGAKSRGPRTAEGKARSSRNAIRHGLRARRWVLLGGESEAEFKRLEAALVEEWAPEGVTQSLLVQQIAAAAWRLGRAEQIETQVITTNTMGTGSRSLGLAVISDCNSPRALDTLIRYRGSTQAEFYRALRTLEALQAKAAAQAAQAPAEHARRTQPNEPGTRIDAGDWRAEASGPNPSSSADAPTGGVTDPNPSLALAPAVHIPAPALAARPDEPKSPRNPGDSAPPSDRANPGQASRPAATAQSPAPPVPAGTASCAQPFEPEIRRQPSTPPAMASETVGRASLLAGTALGSGGWLGGA